MPELPDLEIIKEFLEKNASGDVIEKIEVIDPLVLRCSREDLVGHTKGKSCAAFRRRGKFLIFDLPDDGHLIFHLMLAGRFQYSPATEKGRAGLCLSLEFTSGRQLRYYDRKRMGRIYLVSGPDFSAVPQFAEQGPEAIDSEMDLEEFHRRLRRHPGMIKNILTNQRFLAGIGNAYADEILFCAGILPFRRRSSLSAEEVNRLYRAVRSVLSGAIEELRKRVGASIHREIRDFMKVHGKGGQLCSACGGRISEVAPNRRRTNFCRGCQR
jgi:formamidopyrimidine-DNA glycosylase